MKKVASVVLILLLLGFACAEGILAGYGIDIGSLTDEE